MIKVKTVKKRNPLKVSESKHYGFPVNEGVVTLEEVAGELSTRSTITHGDVINVLQNFVEFIPFVLMLGKSINLAQLGTMRISFSSKGVEKPEDFNVGLITKKRIIYTPSADLKRRIRDCKFEMVRH